MMTSCERTHRPHLAVHVLWRLSSEIPSSWRRLVEMLRHRVAERTVSWPIPFSSSPPRPMFVDSFAPVPVEIDPASGFALEDLAFEVADGPKAGRVSRSRDRGFDARRPRVMLLAGWEPGDSKVVVTRQPSGTAVAEAPFRTTAVWRGRHRGPRLWFDGENPRRDDDRARRRPAGRHRREHVRAALQATERRRARRLSRGPERHAPPRDLAPWRRPGAGGDRPRHRVRRASSSSSGATIRPSRVSSARSTTAGRCGAARSS